MQWHLLSGSFLAISCGAWRPLSSSILQPPSHNSSLFNPLQFSPATLLNRSPTHERIKIKDDLAFEIHKYGYQYGRGVQEHIVYKIAVIQDQVDRAGRPTDILQNAKYTSGIVTLQFRPERCSRETFLWVPLVFAARTMRDGPTGIGSANIIEGGIVVAGFSLKYSSS